MVTIRDVADHAGVSKSTVSLVLNKSPQVKEATRIRVEQAIAELGYVCNNNARSLRKRENQCFGVLIVQESPLFRGYEFYHETGLYTRDINNGILSYLADTDYGIITERYSVEQLSTQLPRMVSASRVDGVFLLGGMLEPAVVERLEEHLPVVGVGKCYENIDCVYVDTLGGTVEMLRELVLTGHRNIAMVNPPAAYKSLLYRQQARERLMADYPDKIDNFWQISAATNTGEGGYNAMKELWDSGIRPDGVAAANESLALGAMRFLKEQGWEAPRDYSLVGYAATALGSYSIPPLTTVDIRKEEMGALGAQIMLQRLRDPAAPPIRHMLAARLIRRQSVKSRL